MNELIVTISCITYNHEAFIRDCLEGFVMQQTNFRFEAIVHDDASTDGTAAIIAEYAAKYPDIIKPLYETENQYSKKDDSLNRIMDAHTHGKYVAICEGDDYWTDPHKLQKQVDFLEANPDFSMCFHKAQPILIDRDDSDWIIDAYGSLVEREYTIEELLSNWQVPSASIVCRLEVIKNRPSHKDFHVGDVVLVTTCGKLGRIYCFGNDVMSVHLKHPGGISFGLHGEGMVKIYKFNLAMYECFPEFRSYFSRCIYRDCKCRIASELLKANFANAWSYYWTTSSVIGFYRGYYRLFVHTLWWVLSLRFLRKRI